MAVSCLLLYKLSLVYILNVRHWFSNLSELLQLWTLSITRARTHARTHTNTHTHTHTHTHTKTKPAPFNLLCSPAINSTDSGAHCLSVWLGQSALDDKHTLSCSPLMHINSCLFIYPSCTTCAFHGRQRFHSVSSTIYEDHRPELLVCR